MKRLVSLLSLCSLFAMSAFAEKVVIDGIYYDLNDIEKTVTVTAPPNKAKYQGDIVIPANVTYVGVGYSVTSIGDRALYYCDGLTSITIPNSVTNIGNGVFSECKQIVDVYCNAVFAPTTGTDAFETVTQLSATLHVPESSIGGYKNSSPWGKFIKIVAIE